MSKSTLVIAVSLFFASACGGGSDTAPAPGDNAMTTLTAGNNKLVAAQAADAALNSANFADLTDIIGVTGRTASAPLKIQQSTLVATFGKLQGADTILHQVPVGPVTTNCLIAGSVTLSGEVANPLTLATGDTFNVDWMACDDGVGVVVDGTLGLLIDNFEGDVTVGQVLLESALDIDNFRLTAADDFANVNGDISFLIDTRAPPISVAQSSGSSLEVASNGGTDTLSDFTSTVSEDAAVSPSLYSTDASGTISSTRFSGTVRYETPVTFEAIGAAYPYTGELLVTGANGGTLRLIALDAVNVRLESDFDGDGNVDETTDLTWDELFAT